MKNRGFITIYLIPLFLTMIVISADTLQNATLSQKVINNFIGKEEAKNLAEIGLKHGVKLSREINESRVYYINLIDNNITVSNMYQGNQFAKVSVKINKPMEFIEVGVESESNIHSSYSHKEVYKYVLNKLETDLSIDNALKKLDTRKNSNNSE
ncbi:MAG: hypothetical protein RR515_03905 [Clostridium sp.]